MKIELPNTASLIVFGKKIFEKDEIVGRITRESRNILKNNSRNARTKKWQKKRN